jgi:hypothetical protein
MFTIKHIIKKCQIRPPPPDSAHEELGVSCDRTYGSNCL